MQRSQLDLTLVRLKMKRLGKYLGYRNTQFGD